MRRWQDGGSTSGRGGCARRVRGAAAALERAAAGLAEFLGVPRRERSGRPCRPLGGRRLDALPLAAEARPVQAGGARARQDFRPPRKSRAGAAPGQRLMSRTWRVALLALLLALLPAWSGAQQAPAGAGRAVPWSALTSAQRRLLGQLHDRWAQLPPARQRALVRGSRLWLHMTPAERHQAQRRFAQWRRMSPQQRAVLRRRWQRFRALPPAQRAAIRRSFRAYERLPAWRRRMLRKRWQRATPAERRMMIQRLHQRMMRQRMMRQMQRRQLRSLRGMGRFGGGMRGLRRGGRPPSRRG